MPLVMLILLDFMGMLISLGLILTLISHNYLKLELWNVFSPHFLIPPGHDGSSETNICTFYYLANISPANIRLF